MGKLKVKQEELKEITDRLDGLKADLDSKQQEKKVTSELNELSKDLVDMTRIIIQAEAFRCIVGIRFGVFPNILYQYLPQYLVEYCGMYHGKLSIIINLYECIYLCITFIHLVFIPRIFNFFYLRGHSSVT